MDEAHKLRDLAAWYREFAERAGEPWIWESRLRTAAWLEKEAALLEMRLIKFNEPSSPPETQVQRAGRMSPEGEAGIHRGS